MAKITNHAKKRMKERAGVGKGELNKTVNKALYEGIKHNETKGELKKWIDAEYLKCCTANNCRLYKNKLYIFHNETLITILDAPLIYEEKLSDYVIDNKIYIRYKLNRLRGKKKTEYIEKAITELNNCIKIDLENYIKSHIRLKNRYREVSLKLVNRNYQLVIVIQYIKKDDNTRAELIEYIRNNYGKSNVMVRFEQVSIINKKDKEQLLSENDISFNSVISNEKSLNVYFELQDSGKDKIELSKADINEPVWLEVYIDKTDIDKISSDLDLISAIIHYSVNNEENIGIYSAVSKERNMLKNCADYYLSRMSL